MHFLSAFPGQHKDLFSSNSQYEMCPKKNLLDHLNTNIRILPTQGEKEGGVYHMEKRIPPTSLVLLRN